MKKLYHVKKGDTVRVNTGNWKGVTATVIAVLQKKDRLVLEISDMTPAQKAQLGKRTIKKTQQNPGQLVDRAVSVHVSNVNLVEKFQSEVNKDA